MGKKEQVKSFIEALLLGSGPSFGLLGAFFLGLIMTGILSNLAYDLLVAPAAVLSVFWTPLAASLILFAVAYLLFWLDRRWRLKNIRFEMDKDRLASPHSGLIWLLGPSIDHLLLALKHHYEGGGAKHCWLVMQHNAKPIQDAYDKLTDSILENKWNITPHPVYIEQLDAQSAYNAVYTILSREVTEAGLAREDVIADITSGTKPLTAGMVLAVIALGGTLEYIETPRDEKGQFIEGKQQVVMVDTKFYFSSSNDQP